MKLNCQVNNIRHSDSMKSFSTFHCHSGLGFSPLIGAILELASEAIPSPCLVAIWRESHWIKHLTQLFHNSFPAPPRERHSFHLNNQSVAKRILFRTNLLYVHSSNYLYKNIRRKIDWFLDERNAFLLVELENYCKRVVLGVWFNVTPCTQRSSGEELKKS